MMHYACMHLLVFVLFHRAAAIFLCLVEQFDLLGQEFVFKVEAL